MSVGMVATATSNALAQFNSMSVTMPGISKVPYLKLNNGVEMPQLGLGTFAQPSNEVCRNSVLAALQAGFRHIDTAHGYNDERGVGQGIVDSGVNRKDIWLTSKLWVGDYDNGKTLDSLNRMLDRLQTDYLDLLYIHHPVGEVMNAWKAMEKAVEQGKVRALGISNFDYPDKIVQDYFYDICNNQTMRPQVIQLETNIYAQRRDMREKIRPYDIQLECWFPLGGMMGVQRLSQDPVIQQIAKDHDKSAVQTMLRWHIQEGFSVIPGSKNPDHIKENIDIFDFELSEDEMNQIRALDKGTRTFQSSYADVEQRQRTRQIDEI
jgi:diketogulonate reductase-like aldo/keto reductase